MGAADEDEMRLEAVDADGNNIKPKDSCKLLGVVLSRNLSWENNLREDKASLHGRIRKRLSAL